MEVAIRESMVKLGASLLEQLLGADTGYGGGRIDCGAGHQAVFVSNRQKTFHTALGSIKLARAYYHCSDCHTGVVPRDDQLGLAGVSISPGLRAMTDRVAETVPFAKAAKLMSELAGIPLTAKRIERCAEADGAALVELAEREAAAAAAGQLVPFATGEPPEKLYLALDGTGVPMVPAEVAGRAGKDTDGGARTREAKLAVLFTQTKVDDEGYPVRDPDSSSYIATFEGAERFGDLLKVEARRRGSDHTNCLVALGDGAAWIWNLVAEHFTTATQIVDFYHARQHVHDLAKLVAPAIGERHHRWLDHRLAELEAGDIEGLLRAGRRLKLSESTATEVEKALGYFQTNAERMRYAHFRNLGHFVGSGAVESGCKAVIPTFRRSRGSFGRVSVRAHLAC